MFIHSWIFHLSILLLSLQGTIAASDGNSSACRCSAHGVSNGGHNSEPRYRFRVVENLWHHVETIYIVTCWLLVASVLKILFHMAPWFPSHVPESAALITLGIILGIILKFSGVEPGKFRLSAFTFFYFMLPPIVFDSGFHMPNRAFFGNLGTILSYAVIGTCFNATCTGLTLWGITKAVDYDIGLLTCLLYGSLISAVDPVGVLSVFEEVHVNEMLYIIVFGESLLNDAITVVLYNIFNALIEIDAHGSIIAEDIILGVVSVFVVGFGGVAIGIIFGLITAFVTRFTDHVRVIEPIFIFIFGYLSYLTADMFRLSGILAAVFCGIIMRRYVNANVRRKSQTVINYSVKMIAVVSETVVFMFIGMTSVLDLIDFNVAFFFSSIATCLVSRPIGVVLVSIFVNRFRTIKLTWLDQFIMSYGGLRGPIAYALCVLIDKSLVPEKDVLLSACLGVIFFTCYVQGGTIRFLVEGLRVKRASESRPSMNQRLNERLVDHSMAGIEEISGIHGSQYMRVLWESFDNKFLKPLLLKQVPQTREGGIIKTFTALNIQDAIKNARENRPSSSNLSEQHRQPSATGLNRRALTHDSVVEALNMVFQRGASNDRLSLAGGGMTPSTTALDLQRTDSSAPMEEHETKIRNILDDAMYKPKGSKKSRLMVARHNVLDHETSFINRNPRARWHVRELMTQMSRHRGKLKHRRQTEDSSSHPEHIGHPEVSDHRPENKRVAFALGGDLFDLDEAEEPGLEMQPDTSSPDEKGTSEDSGKYNHGFDMV